MEVKLSNVYDNIIAFELEDWNDEQADSKWMTARRRIARTVFDQCNIMVVVSPIDLVEIVSDDAKNYRMWLKCGRITNEIITREVFYRKRCYKVNMIRDMPRYVLDDLINSQEFMFNNLWLFKHHGDFKINQELIADVEELVSKNTFLKMPALRHEVLSSTPDGDELLWFNPNEQILKVFNKEISSSI